MAKNRLFNPQGSGKGDRFRRNGAAYQDAPYWKTTTAYKRVKHMLEEGELEEELNEADKITEGEDREVCCCAEACSAPAEGGQR